MPYPVPLKSAQASSYTLDAVAAVNEIKAPLMEGNPDASIILFFCSAQYNLEELGKYLKSTFPKQKIIGCTSAGQINQTGFSDAKLTAISISGGIEACSYLIDLNNIEDDIVRLSQKATERFHESAHAPAFGILNIDGLSMREEIVAAELYKRLPPFPFVGGSAGDDNKLEKTFVYYDGKFLNNHAVFSIFETRLPHAILKIEHYRPTADRLVVTESNPDKRIIHELNGEPAVEVYARTLGKSLDELDDNAFIVNPFLFGLGNQQFVRDIKQVNEGGSLSMFCAIETGMVLTLGKPRNIIQSSQEAFQKVKEKVGDPALIIGFDCLHRKLGFKMSGLLKEAGEVYQKNNVFGFSTYGEQYNGIHINQTFSGIAIGNPNETE